MRLGYSYWVVFTLPPTCVIMFSVPDTDRFVTMALSQVDEGSGHKATWGSTSHGPPADGNTSCVIPLTVQDTDVSVTKVTLGRYRVLASESQLTPGTRFKVPAGATQPVSDKMNLKSGEVDDKGKHRQRCGKLKRLWQATGHSPQPVVSRNMARLRVKAGSARHQRTDIGSGGGFRIIFTYHQVPSPPVCLLINVCNQLIRRNINLSVKTSSKL